jgi:hypothetical protein
MEYEAAAFERAPFALVQVVSLPFSSLVRLLPDKPQRLFCLVSALASSRKEGVARNSRVRRPWYEGAVAAKGNKVLIRDEHLRQNCFFCTLPLISLRDAILLGL